MLEINNITSNAHGTLFIKPELIILNKSLNKFWSNAEDYRFAQFTDEDSLLKIIKLAIESEQHIVLLDDGINHEIRSIIAELTDSFSIIPYNTIPEVVAANDMLKNKSPASEVISAQLLNIHCINESKDYLSTEYKNGFKQHIVKLAAEAELENFSTANSFIESKAMECCDFSLTLNHDGKKIFNLRSSEISHIHNKNQNGLLYFKWNKTETKQAHLVLESNEILQSTNHVLSQLSKTSSTSISHLFELESLTGVLVAKIKTLGDKPLEQETYALLGLFLIEQAIKLALQLNRRTNAYFLNRKGLDFALFYIDKSGKNTFISELVFNHYLATSKLDLYRDIVNFDLKKCGQYLSNLNKSKVYACSNLDKLNLLIQLAALFSKFKFKHYAELELNQIDQLTLPEDYQLITSWYVKFAHIAIHHENAFQYKRKTADILQDEETKETLEKLSTVVYDEFTNLSFEYFDRELTSTLFDLSNLFKEYIDKINNYEECFSFTAKLASSENKAKWYNIVSHFQGIRIQITPRGNENKVHISIRPDEEVGKKTLKIKFKKYLDQPVKVVVLSNNKVVIKATLEVLPNYTAIGYGVVLFEESPNLDDLRLMISKV
ncbi:hypothetical protein NBRC116592_34520 [Colwellia sp. KU-HH00111]|uniref:hypothetical protein n=1 Tax=Colwellia sp. KU-HH00111 TaxID=3127652 RepID=UPI00310965C8